MRFAIIPFLSAPLGVTKSIFHWLRARTTIHLQNSFHLPSRSLCPPVNHSPFALPVFLVRPGHVMLRYLGHVYRVEHKREKPRYPSAL